MDKITSLENDTRLVLMVNVLVTVFMTGLIWFVQIVHYPLFAGVGAESFASYAGDHARLTTWVVAVPMLVEVLTALGMLQWRPAAVSIELAWLGILLVVVIWTSTWLLQVPHHQILAQGFDDEAYRSLLNRNWLRTAAWSARSLLMLALLGKLLRPQSSRI